MPRSVERKLQATAKKRGYSKKRADAYTFGTLARLAKKSTRKK